MRHVDRLFYAALGRRAPMKQRLWLMGCALVPLAIVEIAMPFVGESTWHAALGVLLLLGSPIALTFTAQAVWGEMWEETGA